MNAQNPIAAQYHVLVITNDPTALTQNDELPLALSQHDSPPSALALNHQGWYPIAVLDFSLN